ncbi:MULTISPECIES: ATP-grasp domain-containing protein [unclassified Nocardiopsis]|uniref:ATP-grasp domain-containing protein n=1 Tax=unclassified Nocardiopsis TaxID=2649073 RepID=UPI0013599216|nr:MULTISPECIES: ATP-grasp domain-containing protein [unclassified Nocardiopsis]
MSGAAAGTGGRPTILLVGVVFEHYRGYLLRSVARVADVWLLAERETTWEDEYLVGSTVVDTSDAPALIAAARRVARRRPVGGVLCWDELKMENSARIAADLGLPGVSADVVDRCRDKYRTRVLLGAAGVPQPRSALLLSPQHAARAAPRIGFPVVFKPRALGASMGVVRADSAEEVEGAYAHARAAHVPIARHYEAGVLVEQCVEGPEISVDSACVNGRVLPLFVARKQSGFPPYFEETGHTVDGADPLLSDPGLRDVLGRAHRALGFTTGMTHTELRRGPNGEWRVIEVNCRLGGDLIPFLGEAATGIDAARIAAEIALGREPEPAPLRRRAAGVRFLYPDRALTVERVVVRRSSLPSSVVLATPTVPPGARVAPPPEGHVWGRYALVVAVEPTVRGCREALSTAAEAFELRAVREERVRAG